MVSVAKANLCIFWKVGSVIYDWGPFAEKNSMVAALPHYYYYLIKIMNYH